MRKTIVDVDSPYTRFVGVFNTAQKDNNQGVFRVTGSDKDRAISYIKKDSTNIFQRMFNFFGLFGYGSKKAKEFLEKDAPVIIKETSEFEFSLTSIKVIETSVQIFRLPEAPAANLLEPLKSRKKKIFENISKEQIEELSRVLSDQTKPLIDRFTEFKTAISGKLPVEHPKSLENVLTRAITILSSVQKVNNPDITIESLRQELSEMEKEVIEKSADLKTPTGAIFSAVKSEIDQALSRINAMQVAIKYPDLLSLIPKVINVEKGRAQITLFYSLATDRLGLFHDSKVHLANVKDESKVDYGYFIKADLYKKGAEYLIGLDSSEIKWYTLNDDLTINPNRLKGEVGKDSKELILTPMLSRIAKETT